MYNVYVYAQYRDSVKIYRKLPTCMCLSIHICTGCTHMLAKSKGLTLLVSGLVTSCSGWRFCVPLVATPKPVDGVLSLEPSTPAVVDDLIVVTIRSLSGQNLELNIDSVRFLCPRREKMLSLEALMFIVGIGEAVSSAAVLSLVHEALDDFFNFCPDEEFSRDTTSLRTEPNSKDGIVVVVFCSPELLIIAWFWLEKLSEVRTKLTPKSVLFLCAWSFLLPPPAPE